MSPINYSARNKKQKKIIFETKPEAGKKFLIKKDKSQRQPSLEPALPKFWHKKTLIYRMKGSRTKKTIEQHIEDGTYRSDRHGYISKTDEQTLKELKNDLYTDYISIRKIIKNVDISKPENYKIYEQLNDIRINYVKCFHNIAKSPVETKEEIEKVENNVDGFKA